MLLFRTYERLLYITAVFLTLLEMDIRVTWFIEAQGVVTRDFTVEVLPTLQLCTPAMP